MEKLKIFSRLSVLTLCISIIISSIVFGQNPPQIPEDMKERTFYDQSFNIRAESPLDESERAIIPIYHVEIPARDVDIKKASDFDLETSKFAFTRKYGEDYVRIFFTDPKDTAYKSFSRQYGECPQKYWGTKYQSHGTYLVWGPTLNSRIFIKMPEKKGVTWEHTVKNAIDINDYIFEEFVDKSSYNVVKNDGFISYFPERLALIAPSTISSLPYPISFRNVDPVPKVTNPNVKLLPLHGFLGSPLLAKCAKAKGLTTQEYLAQEYAVTLAKFIAHTNFEMGIYTEAHTQNLLVYVDENSGKIKGFAFRDLNDTAIDPFIRLMTGKKMIVGPIFGKKNVSQIGLNHMGAASNIKNQPYSAGWINGGYIGLHNFKHVASSHESFMKMMESFMDAFIFETEKITGASIDRRKLPSNTTLSRRYSEMINPGYDAFQEVYDQVVVSYTRKISNESKQYSQKVLRDIFLEHFEKTNLVALVDENARVRFDKKNIILKIFLTNKLEYSFDGKNVVAFDKNSNKIIALAYELNVDELKDAFESRFKIPTTGSGSTCFGLLKRFVHF